jgi:hypothetical protein
VLATTDKRDQNSTAVSRICTQPGEEIRTQKTRAEFRYCGKRMCLQI